MTYTVNDHCILEKHFLLLNLGYEVSLGITYSMYIAYWDELRICKYFKLTSHRTSLKFLAENCQLVLLTTFLEITLSINFFFSIPQQNSVRCFPSCETRVVRIWRRARPTARLAPSQLTCTAHQSLYLETGECRCLVSSLKAQK